jgi:hypothetical protein
MSQLEHLETTFDAEAIKGIVEEISRQKKAKRDFLFPAGKMRFTDEGMIELGGLKLFQVGEKVVTDWEEAEALADATGARIVPTEAGALPIRPKAESQLAQRLGLPMSYVSRLRESGYKDLVSHNFTELLHRNNNKLMLRCLDNQVRAVVSDSYRILDNADLFFCAADVFQEVGAQLWKARLWEDGFEMIAVAPHIAGEVSTDRTFDPGDGWQSRWHGEEGDVHNAAIRVSNSETGQGGLNVSPSILRKVCANFNVWGTRVSTIHTGRQRQEEGLILSEETLVSESQTIWLKVKDAIRTAFSPEKFKTYIEMLNGCTAQKLENPRRAVENVVREYALTEERRDSIMAALLGSRDFSRYGLVQSITCQAHDLDKAGLHEQASRMEALGGQLVEMADGPFSRLVGANA